MRIGMLLTLALALPAVAYASLVNINTANATLLDTLPGIGPSKAAAIVEYRTKNGPFATTEDVQKVSGIGPVTFAHMKDRITVGTTHTSFVESQPPTSPAPQPSSPPTSYTQTQPVEPISNTQTSTQAHEETVQAPTATIEPAAVGAALPSPELVTHNSRVAGLFSAWTLGLLGVIVVAGSIFIFL